MKKLILGLLIFILCIATIAAVQAVEERLIYDKWVFADQSVYVNNQVFLFWRTTELSKITVSVEGSIINLEEGECEKEGYTKICYDEYDYDIKEEDYKFKVRIYAVVPDITITRTIDKSSLLVGEEAEITVKLENVGGRTAFNPVYADAFPSFIEIVDTTRCTKNGSTIIWDGSIGKGEEKEFSYTIKSSREVDLRSKAELSYFDGMTDITEYSPVLRIQVEPFLGITPIFDDDSVPVGNRNNLTINLTNNLDEDDIKVNSFRVDVPKTLIVNKYPNEMEKIGDSYFWDDNINEKDSVELDEFKFDTTRVGIATIFLTANISYDGEDYIITKAAKFEIENVDLFINTNLDDNELFESDQEENIKIWVQNPNNKVKFKNIRISVETNLTDIPDTFIVQLNETEYVNIVDTKFRAPAVDRTTSFPFKVKASYETEYGDKFSEELEVKNIKVEQIKGLTITHSFSKTRPEEREQIRLTVKIKNNRDVDLVGVNIFDVSPNAFIKEGVSSAFVKIGNKETLTVYSYLLNMPRVSENTKFTIKTIADYVFNNRSYVETKETDITVIPRKVDISISKSIDKEDVYYQGQILELDYTIKNSESDEIIRDIIIYPPKQKEFDVLGKESYLIESLGPGEQIKLDDLIRVRIKINGSLTLEKDVATYRDEGGELFSKESNRISLKVNRSYMQGPVIIVEKDVPIEVKKGSSFLINLLVKNVGDSPTDVRVEDGRRKWEFRLGANGKKELSYQEKIYEKTELEPAVARYHYLAMPFYAYSDEKTVNIIREVEEVEEIIEEEVVPEPEKIEEVREAEGFFARLWNTVLRWFG